MGVWRFGASGGWPLLWCHGGLSCGLDAVFLDDAARRCGAEVLAIDRPAIGRSDPWQVASVADWPPIVEAVAAQLHLGEFAVAGWSAGGPYALACAAAMPLRVRAVATLAGMAPPELGKSRELGLWADVLLIPAARRWPAVAALMLSASQLMPDRLMAWQLRRTAQGRRDRRALEVAHRWILRAMAEAVMPGAGGTVDDYRRFGSSWGFDLGAVGQSVTVWQGERDTLLPMSHARQLAGALNHAELRVVADTGHYLHAVIAEDILAALSP